jgi:hypothetical protein
MYLDVDYLSWEVSVGLYNSRFQVLQPRFLVSWYLRVHQLIVRELYCRAQATAAQLAHAATVRSTMHHRPHVTELANYSLALLASLIFWCAAVLLLLSASSIPKI